MGLLNSFSVFGMPIRWVFTLLLIFILFNTGYTQHKKFRWLIGTWKIKDKNEFEVWKIKKGTATLSAMAFKVQGSDTLITEVINLTYRDHSFHYIRDVAGDQEPVAFQITSFDAKGFVAENPRHDFPKIIRYNRVRKKNSEYIEAAIEGDGKIISYVFEKLK
ncbi:MAG: DUF6265 family protein [Cyclobacteriaceae bacterium]